MIVHLSKPLHQLQRMESIKATIVFSCMLMALTFTCAQNSPKDFLIAHNIARREVHTPPLAWDKNLAKYAQDYANKRANDCDMIHSYGPYGENLAAAHKNLDAKVAVDMWVEEKKFFDYSKNDCVGEDCWHYTQVIWNTTTHVGCARTPCKTGYMFVICSYAPMGNIIGVRPY